MPSPPRLPALVLLLAACAPTEPETETEGPRIVFERTDHDFGALTDVEEAEAAFAFRNAGGEDLVIEAVRTSCGCTVAELPERRFAPGEGHALRVRWEPKGLGPQSQTVHVVSNDPEDGLVTLTVRAAVEPVFRLEPPRLALGHVRMLEEHAARIRVTTALEEAELAGATCTSPHVEIAVRPGHEGGEPGVHSVADVRLLPTAPKGRFFATVRLRFEAPGLEDDGGHAMAVPVSATVYEIVRPQPDLFAVGRVPPGGTARSSIHLARDSGEPFSVAFVEVRGAPVPLEVTPKPYEAGGRHGVELVLHGDVGDYEGPLGGIVSVVTDIPEEGPLEFLVMGTVGS